MPHLQRELGCRARSHPVAAARAEDGDHQGDPDRVVGPCLALQQGARGSGDLAPPSTEKTAAGSVGASAVPSRRLALHPNPKMRCAPTASPTPVTSVPATPGHSTPAGHRAEQGQADAHPAVEQEHDQGNGDDPLVDLDAQGPEVGEQVAATPRLREGTAQGSESGSAR